MYDIEGNLGAFGWAFQGRPHNFYSDDGMGWFHITPLTYPVSSGVYIYVLRLKHMLYILIKKTPLRPRSLSLILLLLNTTCPVLANSVDPDQLASEEVN